MTTRDLLAPNVRTHSKLPLTAACLQRKASSDSQINWLSQQTIIHEIHQKHTQQPGHVVSEWSSKWSCQFTRILHTLYGRNSLLNFSHVRNTMPVGCFITVTFRAAGQLKENHGKREKRNTFHQAYLLSGFFACMLRGHHCLKIMSRVANDFTHKEGRTGHFLKSHVKNIPYYPKLCSSLHWTYHWLFKL